MNIPKNVPMRRCAGCMTSKPKEELIKIAGYEGKLKIDISGREKGRGVYFCKNKKCLEIAQKKRAVQRSLRMEIASEDVETLFLELHNYLEKMDDSNKV